MKDMKLLLLLCVVVCVAFASKSKFQKCIRKFEPVLCRSQQAAFCQNPKNQLACPKRCKLCPVQTKHTKTEFTKVECPVDRSVNSKGKVFCWKANWNNGNGESMISFSPNYEYIDNKKMIVGYNGVIPSDPHASVFAMGDVEVGKKPVTFSVISKLTNDTILEVNYNSYNLPIFPNMYKTVNPSNQSLFGWEAKPELPKDMGMKSFGTRAILNVRGYKISVLPVLDSKYLSYHKNNFSKASAEAIAMLNMAKMVFQHPSLDYRIEINVTKPIEYKNKLRATAFGWVRTVTRGFGTGPDFKYDEVPDNVIVLFITKTPVATCIPDDFKIKFAYNGSICSYKNIRTGIMEYFGSAMMASRVAVRIIGNVLGIQPDHKGIHKEVPIPRFGPKGENCTDVGGFMDILGDTKWTRCSNHDLEKAINNSLLDCLPTIPCPEDNNPLCEVVVDHVPNACATLKDSDCARSCSPICRSAKPTLPPNASCPTFVP